MYGAKMKLHFSNKQSRIKCSMYSRTSGWFFKHLVEHISCGQSQPIFETGSQLFRSLWSEPLNHKKSNKLES